MYNQLQFKSGQELIEQYAPLVKRIAHHLLARLPANVVLDDLIQAGMVGLLEAGKNTIPPKAQALKPMLVSASVDPSLMKSVGATGPRSVHRNGRRVSEAIQAIESRTGRDAQDGEVAAELNITITEYHALLKDSAESRLFSFEKLIGPQEDGPGENIAAENLSPEDEHEELGFVQAIATAIEGLPEREKLVLSLYYDEEMNLKEIGQILGVSESRVSQIHSQAALRLRSRLRDWQ
ncbi:RNA polymerase sigma factor FliA [Aliamphritea spongicola]|nr:RNA polymerase sigma factor FliA [Aliamphritea spongicola]